MTKSHHDYQRLETIEILLIALTIIIMCEKMHGIVKAIPLILDAMAWEHKSKMGGLGTINDNLSI